jgi:hypothetical protein
MSRRRTSRHDGLVQAIAAMDRNRRGMCRLQQEQERDHERDERGERDGNSHRDMVCHGDHLARRNESSGVVPFVYPIRLQMLVGWSHLGLNRECFGRRSSLTES